MSKSRIHGNVILGTGGGGGGAVSSVDGRTGAVTLGDRYVDVGGDTMVGALLIDSVVNPFAGANARAIRATNYGLVNANEGTYGIMGLEARAVKQGTANLTAIGGIRGVNATADVDAAGTVAEVIGVEAVTRNLNASAVVTGMRAFRAKSPSATGAVTSAFGVDVDAQKVTGVTNGYGIYQRGGNDFNYFAGRVAIGVNDFTYALHVNRASTVADTNPQATRNYHSWSATGDVSGTYLNSFGATMSVSNAAGNTFTNAAGEAITAVAGTVIVAGAGAFATYVNGVVGSVQKFGTSTLADARAIMAPGPLISGGTITTATGIDIGPQKVAGVTNGYGIYQRGTNDINVFAGIVQITHAGGLYFGSAGDTTLYRTSANVLRTGGTLTVTNTLNALGNVINVGATPASIGSINLSGQGSIAARNAGNTADVFLVRMTVSDGMVVGNATTPMAFFGSTPAARSTGWAMTAGFPITKAMNPETATLLETARVLATLVDTLRLHGLLAT